MMYNLLYVPTYLLQESSCYKVGGLEIKYYIDD